MIDDEADVLYKKINWNHLVYALSNFSTIVSVLITGEKDARSRVLNVASGVSYNIPFLPEYKSLKNRAEKIITRLTLYSDWGLDDHYRESLFRMRNKTASKLARDIYGIYCDLLLIREQREHDKREGKE